MGRLGRCLVLIFPGPSVQYHRRLKGWLDEHLCIGTASLSEGRKSWRKGRARKQGKKEHEGQEGQGRKEGLERGGAFLVLMDKEGAMHKSPTLYCIKTSHHLLVPRPARRSSVHHLLSIGPSTSFPFLPLHPSRPVRPAPRPLPRFLALQPPSPASSGYLSLHGPLNPGF